MYYANNPATPIISKTLTDTTGALTNWGSAAATPVPVDLTKFYGREHNLVVKATGNGTADGGSKTVTMNIYFSDVLITDPADVPTVLAGRKTAATAITLPNSTETEPFYYDIVFAFGTIKSKARYAYFSFNASASLAAGATVALDVNMVRQEAGNHA
jgi:hypothetical protein